MTLNGLTEHLELLTTTHTTRSSSGRGRGSKLELTGIKKLRELILELAVRGKLVPQSPEDEPASVLLERIAAEKVRLVKEKKIKKQKPLPPVAEDEKPFELPAGWEWVRFGDVTFNRDADRIPLSASYRKTRQGKYDYYGASGVIDSIDDYLFDEPLLLIGEDGANLINRSTPIAFMAYGQYWVNNHAHVLDGISEAFLVYLGLFINAISLEPYVTGTAQPKMNQTKMNMIPFALPPEVEFKGITAKVNELMTHCDQLEQDETNSIAAHQSLVDTLLTTLTDSKNAGELAENWSLVAQHFDTLFTTDHSIEQLKQTILQLAVMGRLVPQNPDDEPAAKLLECVAAEKAQLIKEGKVKKQKPLSPVSDVEKPLCLPDGWEWCRFSEVVNEVATGPFGSMIHKSDYIEGGIPLVNPSHMVESKIVEDSTISITPSKADELKSYRLMPGDIVMARRGEMGRCALVTERERNWLCGTGSFVLKFNSEINRQYVLLLFKTSWVRDYLGGNSVGSTMTNLNHGILNKMPLLLPSLAEQHRIVTRVNELMTLCNTLQQQVHQTQTTQQQLSSALVEQALA